MQAPDKALFELLKTVEEDILFLMKIQPGYKKEDAVRWAIDTRRKIMLIQFQAQKYTGEEKVWINFFLFNTRVEKTLYSTKRQLQKARIRPNAKTNCQRQAMREEQFDRIVKFFESIGATQAIGLAEKYFSKGWTLLGKPEKKR